MDGRDPGRPQYASAVGDATQRPAGSSRAAAGPRRRAGPAVLAVHFCGAVVALACAGWARLPFLPIYSLLERRPTWVGLVTVWALVAAAYVALWYLASRGHRLGELALFVTMLLLTLWALAMGLVTILQGVGVSPSDQRFSLVWWLRALAVVGVLAGISAAGRMRGRQAAEDGATDGVDDALGRHDGLPLPAPLPVFAAGVVVVAVVGLVLDAWTLGRLAPASASPRQAVAAVRGAVARVPTTSVITFDAGLRKAIAREDQTRTRDRWQYVEGLIAGAEQPPYRNDLQWTTQVSYREQLTCVAVQTKDTAIVVFEGICPR